MNRNEAQALALRLLELQQRFESYVILHEEELKEIKATLSEMRRDVVLLTQASQPSSQTRDESKGTPAEGEDQQAEAEELSALLTL